MNYEYAIIEWLWSQESFRIHLPGGESSHHQGSYDELVVLLNGLGQSGWEVVSCAAAGNWLFWTLKRPA